MPDLAGKDIGRYHIKEPLGEGGMASVYLAYDSHLDTDVAVKFIRPEAFPPEILKQIMKRFEREARVLARLNHAAIVDVLDYGEWEGTPYLVMRYIPGGTLKSMLGKQMPYREAARLLLPVARALEYAHGRGILHRDVKPTNILISETGEPVLTDFGIARLLDSREGHTLTGTGVGIGTPEYMAPEQGLGNPVDARADIYALGVVLYELITGRRPFEAPTPMAVMLKHVTDPLPRPRDYVPDLPLQIEKIIRRAMEKNPDDRYARMGDFADVLEKVVDGLIPDYGAAAGQDAAGAAAQFPYGSENPAALASEPPANMLPTLLPPEGLLEPTVPPATSEAAGVPAIEVSGGAAHAAAETPVPAVRPTLMARIISRIWRNPEQGEAAGGITAGPVPSKPVSMPQQEVGGRRYKNFIFHLLLPAGGGMLALLAVYLMAAYSGGWPPFAATPAPTIIAAADTATATPTDTARPSATPTATRTPQPSATDRPTATATSQPTASFTPTATVPSPTPTITASITPDPAAFTISITEIMGNPCGGDKEQLANEYIELYNYGSAAVDVGGWFLFTSNQDGLPDALVAWETRIPGSTVGQAITGSTVIQPGQYALILQPGYLTVASGNPQPYEIPSGTVVLTLANGTRLGNKVGGLITSGDGTHDAIFIYAGTTRRIEKLVSHFGLQAAGPDPTNLYPQENFAITAQDCETILRQFPAAEDSLYNWRVSKTLTPGE